jgi:hypothetical protein
VVLIVGVEEVGGVVEVVVVEVEVEGRVVVEAGATGRTWLENERGMTRIRRVEETMVGSGGMTRKWQGAELDHPLDAYMYYIQNAFETVRCF